MAATYYYIVDLNYVGKEEDYVPYLYDPKRGWIVDRSNILMDRIIGYDDSEPKDSPYCLGCSEKMNLVEQISEEEAMKQIETM